MPIETKVCQAFVTGEFVRNNLIPDWKAYIETGRKFDHAQWVESAAWLKMGADLGYFGSEQALAAQKNYGPKGELEGRVDLKLSHRFSVANPFGTTFDYFIYEWLEPNRPAILALFQAALILSFEFRMACCLSLQRVLQEDDFREANFDRVKGAKIVSFLSGSVDVQPESPECQLAGFLQLIELLAAFETVFPPRDETGTGNPPRQRIAKLIGNLLAWRLDMRNRRVRDNVSVLEEGFWKFCESELQEQVSTWNSSTSRSNLERLFTVWRDRSAPDELFGFGNLPPTVMPGTPSESLFSG